MCFSPHSIGAGKEADVRVKAQDTKKPDTALLNECMQVKSTNSSPLWLLHVDF